MLANRPRSAPGSYVKSRRRSLTAIPPNRYGDFTFRDPGALRRDPLAGVPVLPAPTKIKRRKPSLKKFVAGRSSLWSVAAALSRFARQERNVRKRVQQALLWATVDKKELVNELNQLKADNPPLPDDLAVRIRICRTQVAHLMSDPELNFQCFKYKGIDDVYLFLKAPTSKGRKNQTAVSLEDMAKKATLRSASVCIWVGAYSEAGLQQRDGLGSLYMSTGRQMSGQAQLLLRVQAAHGR